MPRRSSLGAPMRSHDSHVLAIETPLEIAFFLPASFSRLIGRVITRARPHGLALFCLRGLRYD